LETWPDYFIRSFNTSLNDTASVFRGPQTHFPNKILTLFCEAKVSASKGGGQVKVELICFPCRKAKGTKRVEVRCMSSAGQPIAFAISKGKISRLDLIPSSDNYKVCRCDISGGDTIAVVAKYPYRMFRHIFGGMRDKEETYRGWYLVGVNDHCRDQEGIEHVFLAGSPNDKITIVDAYDVSGSPGRLLFHRTGVARMPPDAIERIVRGDICDAVKLMSEELPGYFAEPPFCDVIDCLKEPDLLFKQGIHWISNRKRNQTADVLYIIQSINDSVSKSVSKSD
jgi:hypothetical protein